MAENIILRFIDSIGETTIESAEQLYRRTQELALVLKEQEAAVVTLLEKRRREKEEARELLEERFSRLKEAMAVDTVEETYYPAFEREELKVPFSARLINTISDVFYGYTGRVESFFKNMQEDLYRANIAMPASKYIAMALGTSTIISVIFGIFIGILLGSALGISAGLFGPVLAIPLFFFCLMFARIYPRSKVKARSSAFGREMPFALRHMATQLISGSGLIETMRSVSNSDYGVLSEEFRRVILEIERGSTVEEALERLNLRVESPGLRKVTRQIVSTLRTGGNLANTLKIIADEVATEMRMKLKDFIQTLNTFSLMYMFVVVVAPVLITTLIIAMGIATKSLPIPAATLWLLYFAFFGISVYMSFMVKRFEPKV